MMQRGSGKLVALCGLVLFGSVAVLAAPTVVLNEVAWGGTAAGSQDEWIELRNCTGAAVDLTGWVLLIGETRIPLSVVAEGTVEVRASTIEANGFFLLERTDDTTVSDLTADLLYKGSLSNSGADLVLQDAAGNTVDQIVCGEAGWPAGCASGGSVPFATMERVDPVAMGDVWRTNDGLIACGLDAAGNKIVGTPRAANSATVNYMKDPRVQLLGPVAGTSACPVTVQWQAVDPDGSAAGLEISIFVRSAGAEDWTLVVEHLANQGSFGWDCSALPKGASYEVKVMATDRDRRIGSATSEAFTLR